MSVTMKAIWVIMRLKLSEPRLQANDRSNLQIQAVAARARGVRAVVRVAVTVGAGAEVAVVAVTARVVMVTQ